MTIKRKITVLAAVPVAALVLLMAVSWRALHRTSRQFEQTGEQFAGLIDNEINPLIQDIMLPLINEDVQRLESLQNCVVLMLEADRDVHQAVIAEKMALASTDKEQIQAADESSAENIDQAWTRMNQAAGQFTSDEARQLFATFCEEFEGWKGQTRALIAVAGDESQLAAARASSNDGGTVQAFDSMRDKIDQLQGVITTEIAATIQEVQHKKEVANSKYDLVNASKDQQVQAAGEALGQVEQVRNLAMRSAEAARNTARMIEESVKNAENGVTLAGDVGKTLEEIVTGIQKTSQLVGQIASASQEQTQGIEQVNTAMGQMDAVTQQNAASAEESASASEELTAQAVQMNELVAELAGLVGLQQARLAPAQHQPQSRKPSRTLGHADHAYHRIAQARPGTKRKSPEQMIPLETDEKDWAQFNG